MNSYWLTTIFVIGLLGVASVAGAVSFVQLRQRRERRIKHYGDRRAQRGFEPILEALASGWYARDAQDGKEEYSANLRLLLNLEPHESGFRGLAAAFGNLQAEALAEAMVNPPQAAPFTPLGLQVERNRLQLECVVVGVRDRDGALVRTLALFRDVTAIHKQMQRMTKENEQLKRDVRQFSNIINFLPIPVWLRVQDYAIRYCNIAYSEAAEESPDNKDAQEALELHPHELALARSAAEAGEARSERRHIIIQGARKLYQFTEIPLPEHGHLIGLAQDVTELETVREELQRHMAAQSELLESVTSAVAVFGADTRLKFFNYAFARLWNVEEAWLGGNPTYSEFLEYLREKRRLPEQANFPLFKQHHLRLFTDLLETHEEIFYLPDGRTLRVLAIPHALGGILFAYEDVTDRLALERSYNTLSLVQKATLDNLHEGIAVFGEDGRLRLYNPKFLQIWKLEQAVLSPESHITDVIEKIRKLHPPEKWDEYRKDYLGQLHSRRVQRRRIERTDGAVVDAVSVPLPDGATLMTFFDVTAATQLERSLRERNDALQEADRLKTEFLANVSYELRSPLTSISGFSEMLAQNYLGPLNERQRDYVTSIFEASRQLTHLIDNILDISSIEAGYMRLDVSDFDVYKMLQSVVALVEDRIREHHLHFTLQCPDQIGLLLGDETRIKQILFNLLSNAIKYSETGGNVTLSAQLVPYKKGLEEIAFIIEDEGIGIAPEEQQAVFGKFYKAGGSGGKSGAGLGLSMVKSFVELHGGRIELRSAPHAGTCVICTLPRHNPRLYEYSRNAAD